MHSKKSRLLITFFILIVMSYLLFTPKGAVRFAAIRHGKIKHALFSYVDEFKNENNDTVYYLDPSPKRLSGHYNFWEVHDVSIFKWSTHPD